MDLLKSLKSRNFKVVNIINSFVTDYVRILIMDLLFDYNLCLLLSCLGDFFQSVRNYIKELVFICNPIKTNSFSFVQKIKYTPFNNVLSEIYELIRMCNPQSIDYYILYLVNIFYLKLNISVRFFCPRIPRARTNHPMYPGCNKYSEKAI